MVRMGSPVRVRESAPFGISSPRKGAFFDAPPACQGCQTPVIIKNGGAFLFLAACQACQSVSKPAKLKSALKALIFGTIRAVLVLDREGTRLLTELSVQSMKPKAQRFIRADRDGLYLEVVPGGQKYWWFVSQAGGKRKKVSIGKWPDVSLRRARELLAVKKREAGIACFSPAVEGVLLSEIAEEWYRVRISGFSEGHRARVRRWLDDYVLPKFKGRALATITGPEILAVCREAEGRGILRRRIGC